MKAPTLLVVAKAPVAGLAKTRVASTVGDVAAADLAAASLLDTLDAAIALGWPLVVAMTGDLAKAARSVELTHRLGPARVIPQRGEGLGERLANAHADADAGHGVVQVGMDTPQITVEDLCAAGRMVSDGTRVVGPAEDGGWWLLGLPDPSEAASLTDVPMSRADTGALTETALAGPVEHLRTLRDMDTWEDAVAIADNLPISRLATAVNESRAADA
ncbi:MAG: glycosyltransferase [Aeromicrobium sp.]|nr:glycosyltransferase [Aeromicrobium sp.]